MVKIETWIRSDGILNPNAVVNSMNSIEGIGKTLVDDIANQVIGVYRSESPPNRRNSTYSKLSRPDMRFKVNKAGFDPLKVRRGPKKKPGKLRTFDGRPKTRIAKSNREVSEWKTSTGAFAASIHRFDKRKSGKFFNNSPHYIKIGPSRKIKYTKYILKGTKASSGRFVPRLGKRLTKNSKAAARRGGLGIHPGIKPNDILGRVSPKVDKLIRKIINEYSEKFASTAVDKIARGIVVSAKNSNPTRRVSHAIGKESRKLPEQFNIWKKEKAGA